MKRLTSCLWAAFFMLGTSTAFAGGNTSYSITQGSGTGVSAFFCFSTLLCPNTVLIDNTGAEKGTVSNPMIVNPNGTTAQPVSGAVGSFLDGAFVTMGTKADVAYAGSGSASQIAIEKGIYAAINLLPTVTGNSLSYGAVTTANPSYGTGFNQPISLDTSGNLRVAGSFNAGGFATTAAPTYGNNTSQNLSLDLAGNLRVTGSSVGTVTQGTAAAVGGAWPILLTDGTHTAAVKAASTSPVVGDQALVVALSPNSASLLPASGTAVTADPGEAVVSACIYNTSSPSPANTNTMALQCDSAGRLITSGSGLAQGSTTSGQLGGLTLGAVTTSAPSYTTAQSSPISLDTAGNLRVNVAAGAAGNAAASATNSAVPAQADYGGINVAGNLRGSTGVNPSGAVYAQQMDLTSVGGTTVVTGTGASGSGIPRFTVANDSSIILAAGTALAGKFGLDQTTPGTTNGVSIAQLGATTVATGNGVSGAGALRVAIASDNTAVAGVGAGATGSSVPANAALGGGRAQNAEATAVTNGQLAAQALDLTGKTITMPWANKENMVRGSGSATGTGATTIIAASGSSSIKTYVTGVQCYRSDTGTVALTVTFNDSASTVIVLPNSAGGGGSNISFQTPLVTAGNTAFQFTSGTSATTVYCNAQGYSGT